MNTYNAQVDCVETAIQFITIWYPVIFPQGGIIGMQGGITPDIPVNVTLVLPSAVNPNSLGLPLIFS